MEATTLGTAIVRGYWSRAFVIAAGVEGDCYKLFQAARVEAVGLNPSTLSGD